MKFLVASVLASAVSAFPNIAGKVLQPRTAGCDITPACNAKYDVSDETIGWTGTPSAAQQVSIGRQNCGFAVPCAVFNAEEQYVSTSGIHAFESPGKSDIRGPCPGLNAAANHGYLPRNGVAGLGETIEGLGAAYGMAADLSGFLAAYAIVFDGDLVSQTWSIGGPQQDLLGASTHILPGKAQGISWSHNKYEGDSSISRCDAYINNGDGHSLSTQRFAYAYESGMDNDRYTMDKFSKAFAKNTFRSVAQNPSYFAPLFSTTLVSPAAYNFVIAMMSNHTADEVGGYLDGEIFKTFFAVTGDYPNFEWQPGQERIPENWYRRPSSTPYSAGAGVFGDLISEFLAYPTAFRFGGNVNGPNTYEGIDIAHLTGGTFNEQSLFQGNNFACLIYQSIQQAVPDFISGGTGSLDDTLNFLNPKLDAVFGGLSCPQVAQWNDNNLPGQYPGHDFMPDGPATSC